MGQHVTPHEAQAALDTVEHRRRRVLEEVGLPGWYWWVLAVGWVVLGFLADLDVPVITTVGTFAFGTANAAAMSRVASGRHRTSSLSVRASVAGRHVRAFVVSALVLLGFLTVGL